MLHRRPAPAARTASRPRRRRRRDLRPSLHARVRQHRAEHARAARRVPLAPEPAAPLRLLLGCRDRALRILGPEQTLRGRRDLLVDVSLAPELPAEQGRHGLARQRLFHRPLDYFPTVQPPLRKPRPIERSLRPGGVLVYERLSDAILVTRAKDGDERALAALCERHAPKVENSRPTYSATEGRPRRWLASRGRALLRIKQFRGDSHSRRGGTPSRGEPVPRVAVRQRADARASARDERVSPDADRARGGSVRWRRLHGSCDIRRPGAWSS